LFSLLSGNYDANGTWEDLSNSGLLTNNLWDSTTIMSGNYQFKYTVLGSCDTFDQSAVNVVIKALPENPIASVDEVVCNTKSLKLYATSIPFGSYLWTGPNGFSSSEQNPVLNNISDLMNGTYTVKGFTNDCNSELSSVDVIVNPLPEFTIKGGCVGNQYIVTAFPANNSYDPIVASYSWAGPEGFSSLENPVQISNLPIGLYEVEVVNSFGCAVQNSIQISGTHCLIPNVITPNNDTFNEELNLSGLLIDKLEVYNRWGTLVYHQNDYTNQWHGQNMRNEQLPDSTYYYIIYFQSGEEKQGWIFVSGQ
jgi:gliding motility-associated-like protein